MSKVFLYFNEDGKSIDCDEATLKRVVDEMQKAGIEFEHVPSVCRILALSVDGQIYKGFHKILLAIKKITEAKEAQQ